MIFELAFERFGLKDQEQYKQFDQVIYLKYLVLILIIIHFFLDKYYIPFCSYDRKYKTINFYGYFNYSNNRKYRYEVKIISLSNYKIEVYNSKVNFSIKKLILKKRKLSLCIVSIFKGLNIINIIRTCLLYKILGVEHITLYISYYDYTCDKYFKWISSQNWIDIIYISIPKVSTYYFGQDSKLDHCINHYRYNSRYVIITDVDEVILPKEKKNITVDSIQSSIFSSSKKGCRLKYGYEKMIIRPEKLISIGAHFPQKWQEKGEITVIDTNDAYVRHSRMINRFIKNSNCTFIYQSSYLSSLIEIIEKDINTTQIQ